MESIKHPAMITSIINSVFLLGMSAYFYKKTSSLEEQIQAMDKNVKGCVKAVGEIALKNKTEQLEQAFQKMNETIAAQDKKIKKSNKVIEALQGEIVSMQTAIDTILKHYESKGEKIDIKKPKTGRFVKPVKVAFTEEDDSSADEAPKKSKKKDESSDDESSDSDVLAYVNRTKASRSKR